MTQGADGQPPSNGESNVVTLHPDGVEALARRTASRLQHLERESERDSRFIAALYKGQTDWQRDTTKLLTSQGAVLRELTNKIQVLTAERIVRPALSVLVSCFFGVAFAALVYLLATHR